MQFMNMEIDPAQLMTRQELLDYLTENGATDRVLTKIRNRQSAQFGHELIWQYPLSDGWHHGFFIVPVREGFLGLPYDAVDAHNHEMLLLEKACLLDFFTVGVFMEDWRSYSEALLAVMDEIRQTLA